jgi:hypothetical protein
VPLKEMGEKTTAAGVPLETPAAVVRPVVCGAEKKETIRTG